MTRRRGDAATRLNYSLITRLSQSYVTGLGSLLGYFCCSYALYFMKFYIYFALNFIKYRLVFGLYFIILYL